MYSTQDIKEHNQEIIELADVLCVLVQHHELRHNQNVCSMVKSFNEKVWMHLVFDEKSIYLGLLDHPQPDVAEKAAAFKQQTRKLRKRFSNYVKNWCHNNHTSQEHKAFVDDSDALFIDIKNSVYTEIKDILPLVTL